MTSEDTLLSSFVADPNELYAMALLLLDQKHYFEKIISRRRFESDGIRKIGFSLTNDAVDGRQRIADLAGDLLQQAAWRCDSKNEALLALAELHFSIGNIEECLSYLDQIEGEPEKGKLLIRGKALCGLGRFEEAVALAARLSGLAKSDLIALKTPGFLPWSEKVDAELVEFSPASALTAQWQGNHDGADGQVAHNALQPPLLAAKVRDLVYEDTLIRKDGWGYRDPDGEHGASVILETDSATVGTSAGVGETVEDPCVLIAGSPLRFKDAYRLLAQTLPCILHLKHEGVFEKRRLAMPRDFPQWGLELIARAGLDPSSLRFIDMDAHTLFRDVLVPEFRTVTHTAQVDALRRAMGSEVEGERHRRIYLIDQHGPDHLLLNESELADVAVSLGFEVVDIATMPIDERLQLLSETAVIAGANSPEMGHMILVPSGAQVVCMAARETLERWHPDLAGLCGHSFNWCLGSVAPAGRGSETYPHLPYTIATQDFTRSLQRATQTAERLKRSGVAGVPPHRTSG